MPASRLVLGALGVGPDAEDAYQFLLAHPGATLGEVQRGARLTRGRTQGAINDLERGALVSRRSGTPARFQPAPPDIAIAALINAKEEALHQARLDTAYLQSLQQARPGQAQISELIEILDGREAYAERWAQLQATTTDRLEVFVRPPFVQNQPEESESPQRSLLGRSVISRGVYDEDALRHPGIIDHARRMADLGEEARVVARLPMKVSLSDRRIALVPFVQVDPGAGVEAGLAVHESTLLDALIALFDLYWDLGIELPLAGTAAHGHSDPADESRVLPMLAAGWKDDAIASHLGVSTRTVRRRITALEDRLGVSTRFQAGLALGRRGWPQDRRSQL